MKWIRPVSLVLLAALLIHCSDRSPRILRPELLADMSPLRGSVPGEVDPRLSPTPLNAGYADHLIQIAILPIEEELVGGRAIDRRYRLELRRSASSAGRPVWEARNLELNPDNTILVAISQAYIGREVWRIDLYGTHPGGSEKFVTTFLFKAG